jgi:hypothetical protein
MDVRVDQPGQHRCAPGVEERGINRGKFWSDGRNSTVAHEDRDSSARRCAGAVDQPGVADEEIGSTGLAQRQCQDRERDARADDDDTLAGHFLDSVTLRESEHQQWKRPTRREIFSRVVDRGLRRDARVAFRLVGHGIGSPR